ncbi:MAG: undecaprenyl-diphosphate phosphatase [bacterium]
MNLTYSIIYGAIQGFAEMLPVSSSAHLVLFPYIFKNTLSLTDPGLAFDVALHFGTLIAILAYFWKDWINLFKATFEIIKTRSVKTSEQKLVVLLLIASVPGAIIGALFNKYAETVLRDPLLIAFTLASVGLLLLYADSKDKGVKEITDITNKNALLIGLSQALAIIPGVSRMGITNTTGLFLGLKREDIGKFSLLMSAPIIAGASLMKFKDITGPMLSTLEFWAAILSSMLFSYLAILILLSYLRNHSFKIFAYYRFALAALVIIIYLTRR